MSKIIDAIYENGVFRPLIKIKLPEHKKLKIIIADKTASTKSKKNAHLKGSLILQKTVLTLTFLPGMTNTCTGRQVSENLY